jgi:L-alanine-DL-glutamate epimerase-like enolase superfamily enzyme
MIAAIEILRVDKNYFVRTTSTDGASGIAVTNEHAAYLYPLLQQRIAPCFLGKDARDLETLVDRAYTHKSNYKLAGLALWNCIAYVELSLFDLLGKLAGKSVGDLLGGIRRRQIPIYLSSLRRDTTPEEEVTWISERIAETQAKAVKLKVGGRMSGNADAFPGRSEKLITLARKTWGDAITIYVDANGSYDAAHAIEVGQVLQSHGVALFEEPCPFDEYEQTKQVADALTMMVSGGEQDTSFARFRWMIQNRGVDLVQPDIIFNGGFIRALRVARLAQAAEMMITPHCPRANPQLAYMLHFASVVPNLGPFQEFRAEKPKSEWWRAPSFQAHDGVVAVPSGPGLGVEYDPTMWNDAEIV